MTPYTGPEAFDRRFSKGNCLLRGCQYVQIFLIPTFSKIDLTFCSYGKSYWLLKKLLYKTEYNLCDYFEALSW